MFGNNCVKKTVGTRTSESLSSEKPLKGGVGWDTMGDYLINLALPGPWQHFRILPVPR